MADPQIAGMKSFKLEVEPQKTYLWCACGRSKSQPFCDDSHVGTDFTPVEISFEEAKLVSFCMCKRSKLGPICDGTHKGL